MTTSTHPFSPLSGEEIERAAALIRPQHPEKVALTFKAICLHEPPKQVMSLYLEAEHTSKPLPDVAREAFVWYYVTRTNHFFESVVNLTDGKVTSTVKLGANIHGPGDGIELEHVEKMVLSDTAVVEAIKKLELPEGSVVVTDPWVYGSDGIDDDDRLYQCFCFLRLPDRADDLDSNHYAHPLPICPVFDVVQDKVIRVDMLPTGKDHSTKPPSKWDIAAGPNEYMHEYQEPRKDLKPLNVVQPEGASFKLSTDNTIPSLVWQKWSFKIGFNYREGMVLYDVRYDNRPLFYRVALSEMNIPYADPRHPFHKKAAFDLGDAGAGTMANNLQLGCDCLGSIAYLSGVLNDAEGKSLEMPNVMCIHEQDNGIGWKHTNYRTGRAAITRRRELVLQGIITVANYEYILAFIFDQAGELSYECRATGILSTQPIDPGLKVDWGTIVHPGALAAHHQHIFSLRVDPMLDGKKNTLVYEEAYAMPVDKFNPHRVGYTTRKTVIDTSGGYDLDIQKNRVFKILNNDVRNPINDEPVGYKIHVPPFQYMLAADNTFHINRAQFAKHNIFVTKYADDEFYAAGRFTNQSRGGTGVQSFADRRDGVADEDIVVWIQFGINHVPRIEDFPVMPVEIIKVSLRPVNFFTKNPALDVPASTQETNKSTKVPLQVGKVDGVADCCHGVVSAHL